ncbi:hypothetical protein LUX57_33560 [Actinomadura madurae]|uniref:hypothetical protein n=1 Tax=Actinomadura madurae TaxID=1993 RepID=UPI0020D23327|nr:hypothetical protein [Actinomadura madurae]MCP9969504.1 hypothetical protein [Actinomadura madurae]
MGCRVVLRRMRAGDEEEFVRLARQSTELHADWVRTPADPAAFRDYLGRFADPTAGEALLVKQADTGAIAATSPSPESSAGRTTARSWVSRPSRRAPARAI